MPVRFKKGKYFQSVPKEMFLLPFESLFGYKACMKQISIFTDGSCLGNPGPGGWAAILRYGDRELELSGGFSLTTNNRMEIMAALAALRQLKEPCLVELFTDSQYLRHAVERKWLDTWVKNGWRTASGKPVKNRDLWEKLHMLLNSHQVHFSWIKGHSGHTENERCDNLARMQASRGDLLEDKGYLSDSA